MRLPGFTAEATLGKTAMVYERAAIPDPAVEKSVIVPQFWFCHGRFCCDEYGNCIYVGARFQ